MGVLPGTKPTGPALTAASVAGGPAVSAAASTAKAKRKAAKGNPGPLRHQPNNLNDLPPDWHGEELDARKADAEWAAAERKAGRDPDRSTVSDEEPATAPAPASPGAGPSRGSSLPSMPAAASTGTGFALGLLGWALGLAYLQGGAPQVKKWLLAKFLNEAPGGQPL